MEGDRLEVEAAVKVDRRDDVLERGDDALDGRDVLLLEGERRRLVVRLCSCWRSIVPAATVADRGCWGLAVDKHPYKV